MIQQNSLKIIVLKIFALKTSVCNKEYNDKHTFNLQCKIESFIYSEYILSDKLKIEPKLSL